MRAAVIDVTARSVVALLITAGFVLSIVSHHGGSPLKPYLIPLCATLFATCFVLVLPGPRPAGQGEAAPEINRA